MISKETFFDFWIISVSSLVVCTFHEFTETRTSSSRIPALYATLPVRGEKIISPTNILPSCIPSSIVGRSFVWVSVLKNTFTQKGVLPIKKSPIKRIHVRTKFILTHARRILDFANHPFHAKLSFSGFSSRESSHLSRTNPPSGIQFRVYSVHFLS